MGDVWVALGMSAVAMGGGATRGRVVQRWLLGVVLAALVGLMAVGLGAFVWPSGGGLGGEFAVGPASDFAPGSVTSYVVTPDGVRELPPATDYEVKPGSYPMDGRDVFHVVRFPNGELRVLSGASTHRGRVVVWLAKPILWVDAGYVGLFIEPAHSEQWLIDGTRVFGPAPRNLDEYRWHLDDGVLVVELGEVVEGERGGVVPPPYDVTAEGWATSGWPSESAGVR